MDNTTLIQKMKTVSHSQFSIWFTCPHKFFHDYILHEKVFEDIAEQAGILQELLNAVLPTGLYEEESPARSKAARPQKIILPPAPAEIGRAHV